MEQKTKTNLLQAKKIFVNRSLNFEHIKMVGFDMDHTLAPYHRDSFEGLAFIETLKKFVEAGYPEELLNLRFNPQFLIRGLWVDQARGNLLKVDGHKYVKIAYHGHKMLSKKERYDLYNSHTIKSEDFLSVDTLFALSEVQLFVEIVHYMDENPERIQKSYKEVYDDLRKFIDLCHRDGSIKNKVIREVSRYIIRDKYLPTALIRLIEGGKKLFLLTNSLYDYTHHVMSEILDDAHPDYKSWKDYFDFIIVGSGKPGFFVGSQPFLEVVEESNLLKIMTDDFLERGQIYHGGNAKLLERITNHRGDEILYVGDHIYGDIIQSKGTLNWRTLLVVEELEQEIQCLEANIKNYEALQQGLIAKELLDEKHQKSRSMQIVYQSNINQAQVAGDNKKAQALSNELEKIKNQVAEQEAEIKEHESQMRQLLSERQKHFHPIWGELMKVGFERSRFAKQLESYACLYTSKASNLRFYNPFKKFISYNETMPHDV